MASPNEIPDRRTVAGDLDEAMWCLQNAMEAVEDNNRRCMDDYIYAALSKLDGKYFS